MTTPQSGREAFEALIRESRRYMPVLRRIEADGSLGLGLATANGLQHAIDKAEAALAQQGREAGELVDGVVAINGRPHLVSDPEHFVRTKKAQRLYTAAPKQQAVEVTEDMVARAMTAYIASRGTYSGEVPTDRADIRAALLAALPGKTEVTP